ncbi:MAG: carbohydrate kinase family protein [Mycobacterium sp.]|nr:carbohydrate kinase family protein [Mycobacterium sp.]
MSAPRVLLVGDAGLDTTVQFGRLPGPDEKVVADAVTEGPGGVVANAAVAAARAGARVYLYTSVGDDAAGHSLPERLAAQCVEVHVDISPKHTCRAIILLDGGGEKRLLLSPDAAMYPSAESIAAIDLDGVGWVHTAAYDHQRAGALLSRCRSAGVRVTIDLEPATMPRGFAEVRALLALCHTVFVNERARSLIGDDAVARILQTGVPEVVETLGEHGVRLHTRDTTLDVGAPILDRPVIDTTGAGDALAGWHLARRAAGDNVVDALTLGVAAASLSVRGSGGIASYSTSEEVLGVAEQMKKTSKDR